MKEAGQSDHRPYLDGLRGIAILMVVMVHCSLQAPGLPGPLRDFTFYGVRGVQLFFIVSGLTLTVSHQGRVLELARFAKKRFLRIAPMFYLGAALYLALSAIKPQEDAAASTPLEILATLCFVHGWLPSAINKVVPGGWSIAAEMMFYLLFPLILTLRYRRREMAIAVLGSYFIAGLTNLGLKHFLAPGPDAQTFAFSFWLCHLPAFVVGCWLAADPGYARVTRQAAVLIAVAATVMLMIDSQLRHVTNLLVSISLLALLVWSLGRLRPRFLQSGALPYLGTISFSIYIVHFAIVDEVGPLIRALGLNPFGTFLLVFGATLVVSVLIAAMTYRYIETPFIELGKRRNLRVLART